VTVPAFLHTLGSDGSATTSVVQHEVLKGFGGRGVVLTCAGVSHTVSFSTSSSSRLQGHDFLSRGFFPCYGINEDPVTGSAHCALAPHWLARLGHTRDTISGGKGYGVRLQGYQASKRGGIVNVTLVPGTEEGSEDRVLLAGQCVTTLKSKILA